MDYLTAEEHTCGCNSYATKRISKTATNSRIISSNSATIAAWSKIRLILIVFAMIQLLPIENAAGMPTRKSRIQKRHFVNVYDDVYIQYPCTGTSDDSQAVKRVTPQMRRKSLLILRKAVRIHKTNVENNGMDAINVKRINEWKKHTDIYKFLPQVSPNGTFHLVDWYRRLQMYALSFTYLGRRQQGLDNKRHDGQTSGISKELKNMYENSIEVMCKIQVAINATRPASRGRKPPKFNREDMYAKMNFVSKNHTDTENTDLFFLDPVFSKARFLEFLEGMNSSLSIWLKAHKNPNVRRRSQASQSASLLSSASASTESRVDVGAKRRALGRHRRPKPSLTPKQYASITTNALT